MHSPDGWFRLGRVEVTSSLAVAGLGAIGVVAAAFVPGLLSFALFHPAGVLDGEVWRLVTWPWFDRVSLWSILTLALLWYFGTDLERQVGRSRMARLYLGCWAVLTAVSLGVGLLLGGGLMLGLDMVQLLVLLLWIAEYPRRPFFFGIPAWVVGLVLVALQVLTMVAGRDLGGILSLALSFVLVAVVARAVGLLGDYDWIPGRRKRRTATAWPTQTRSRARAQRRQQSDSARIDELLDKINAQGIHSLSRSERSELDRLRQRRRG